MITSNADRNLNPPPATRVGAQQDPGSSNARKKARLCRSLSSGHALWPPHRLIVPESVHVSTTPTAFRTGFFKRTCGWSHCEKRQEPTFSAFPGSPVYRTAPEYSKAPGCPGATDPDRSGVPQRQCASLAHPPRPLRCLVPQRRVARGHEQVLVSKLRLGTPFPEVLLRRCCQKTQMGSRATLQSNICPRSGTRANHPEAKDRRTKVGYRWACRCALFSHR